MTYGFKIIGISTRSTNKNKQSQYDLGKLWQQFYTENIVEKIPNKVSGYTIAIYTDYKTNYTDEYTAIIGIPVSTLDEVPEGMTGREFQAEKFVKFKAKGEMPNAVMNAWIEIWKKDKELNRKYTYDFEVYGQKSQKGENSEVDIYISTE